MSVAGRTGAGTDALNAAWELLATRPLFIVGGYTLAASPMIAALLYWLRVVTYEDRRALAMASLMVACGALARAIGLVYYQLSIMRVIGFETRRGFGRSTLMVGLSRLNGESLALLGWPLVFPGVFGLMCAGTTVPLAASESRPVSRSLKSVLGHSWQHLGRHTRYSITLVIVGVLFWLGLLTVASVLVTTVLPSLLNVGSADLALVMRGSAWWIGTALIAALFVDMLHSVACCALIKEERARASGADLRARLQLLSGSHGGNP